MRHLFGAGPADFALTLSGTSLAISPSALGTVWDSSAGGSQITDLQDSSGNPAATVTADPSGRVAFYGPDGVSTCWIDFGAGRFVLAATDLGAELDALIGTISATDWISVQAYGSAAGGATLVGDAAITSATNVFTSATGGLTPADVGKIIVVLGAGNSGADHAGVALVTTIAGVTNSTTATLTANATGTVTGAYAFWGHDDTAAVQGAIDAAAIKYGPKSIGGAQQSQTVYIPYGNYILTSPLTFSGAGVRVTGAGASVGAGSVLLGVNTPIISNAMTYLRNGIELDHLTLDGVGAHLITGLTQNEGGFFHDLTLIQRSSGYSIWDHNGATSGAGLQGVSFRNINCTVFGATRTVPAWNFYSCTDETVSGCSWDYVDCTNADGDATQYFFHVSSITTGNAKQSHLTWRDVQIATACGGFIYLASCQGILLENCNSDNFASGNPGIQSLYRITSAGGSNADNSKGVAFIKCSRETINVTGAGTTWWDIQLDSTVSDVSVVSYAIGSTSSFPYFDIAAAGNVVFVACSAAASYTSQAADTLILGGGNPTLGGNPLVHNTPQPSTIGLLAWTWDPIGNSGGTTVTPTSQTLYLLRVDIRRPTTVSKVWWAVNTAGSGGTAGQNGVGLYTSTGTLLGSVMDDTIVTASSGSVPSRTITVASGQSLSLVPGSYFIAILMHASTMPVLVSGEANGNFVNINSTIRAGIGGTGQTSLSGTVTPASGGGLSLWGGLS